MSSLNDEIVQAPWNQYAWIYEMNLHLSGRTEYYGSPMIPSTRWDHWLFGHIYQDTSSYENSYNQRPWYESIWSYLTNNNELKGENHHPEQNKKQKQDSRPTNNHHENDRTIPISYDMEYNQHHMKYKSKNYVDHSMIRRNHNKPHAVIANGTTLQHVPHSLKLLQKACYDNNIPLFIIYRNDDDDENDSITSDRSSSVLHYNNNNRNNKNSIYYHNLSNVVLDVKHSIKYQLIYNVQEYIVLTNRHNNSSSSLWWSWLYYLPSNSWMMFQLGRLYGRIENNETSNKQKTEVDAKNVVKEKEEEKKEKILMEES